MFYDLEDTPNMKNWFSWENIWRSHPFQPQIVHQNVTLVMTEIPVEYENILQRTVCKNHHPHLQHD